MEENRVTEKVYCYDHPSAYNNGNSAMLAALLNKNDNPLEAAALMNGGMGGQWNNPFIYLVWMMFAQRMWGNGWDNNGQNAQNIELQNQIQSLRSQISDNQNSNLVIDAIKGNAAAEFFPCSSVPYFGSVFRTYYNNIVSYASVIS